VAVLLRTLPIEARLARRPGDELVWTMDTELLARVVDEVSILAADRRRRAPVQTPRPTSVTRAGQGKGVRSLVAQAAAQGRVRVTG
jgi:hypothetical protein